MVIQQIRNATLKIQYGAFTILLDPWLQDKGIGFSAEPVKEEMIGVKNPMNDLPLSPAEILKDVDFCLVTHIHLDHFIVDYVIKQVVQHGLRCVKLLRTCRSGFIGHDPDIADFLGVDYIKVVLLINIILKGFENGVQFFFRAFIIDHKNFSFLVVIYFLN